MADETPEPKVEEVDADKAENKTIPKKQPKEFGGKEGLEPTRYGDWEKGGLISDF